MKIKVPSGWVVGNMDGFVGTRIYPSWTGALEGKRLILRDVRMLEGGEFAIHNPWKNVVEAILSGIDAVEQYIGVHGVVLESGANVWD